MPAQASPQEQPLFSWFAGDRQVMAIIQKITFRVPRRLPDSSFRFLEKTFLLTGAQISARSGFFLETRSSGTGRLRKNSQKWAPAAELRLLRPWPGFMIIAGPGVGRQKPTPIPVRTGSKVRRGKGRPTDRVGCRWPAAADELAAAKSPPEAWTAGPGARPGGKGLKVCWYCS